MRSLQAVREIAREAPVRIRIAGGCMEPGLSSGDTVVVVPAPFYWPGDVLVFARSDGRLVAHRMIGLRPGRALRYFTQADDSPEPDSAVAAAAVVGRVERRVPPSARLRALSRFAALVVTRLGARLA